MQCEVAFNQVTTLSWSFEQDLRQVRALGFNSIGLYRRKIEDVGTDVAAALLDDDDMSVSSIGWAGGFTGSDGWGYEDAVADAMQAIDEAAAVGAATLTIISGGLNSHIRKHAMRMLCNALTEISEIAKQSNVQLALEPIHPGCGDAWSFVHDLSMAMDIVSRVNHPSLGLVCDLYHLGLQDPCFDLLAEAASMTYLVQLGDGRTSPCGEMNRCPLGRGSVPLREMVDALRSGGYDGPWEVELLGQDVEQLSYEELLSHSRTFVEQILSN